MPTFDRRTFLKTTGQGALAASFLGMGLPRGAWLTAAAEEGPISFNENKMECDVLVIGGGFAACHAAIKARQNGANVIMVDKGRSGRSGQSPWAGGTLMWDPKRNNLPELLEAAGRMTEYVGNRDWIETILAHSHERYEEMLSWGMPFGTPSQSRMEGGGTATVTFGMAPFRKMGELPNALREYAEKIGVKIIDDVMIVEFLKQNGRIVGAVGISAASSTFDLHTFMTKTTVQAIGGCGLQGPGYPPFHQLTGDGEAMAWRAGAEIQGKEFVMTHWTRPDIPLGDATALWFMENDKIPAHLKQLRSAGVAIGYLTDSEGKKLPARPAAASQYIFSTLEPEFAAHAGKGPVYIVKPDGSKTEIIGGMAIGMSIRHGDGVWAATKQCGTNIPGLYAAGDALGTASDGSTYTVGGSSSMGAMVTGAIAGEAAAKEAAKMGQPSVSQEELARAKQFINMPRERKGGFSPRWVTQLLQNTMTPYFVYFIKKADRLQAALTHIEFMQEHLVPMLLARNPHELRKAHETRSMVLSAEFRLRSALFRNESRGNHYREDFPRRDDKNWLAWTKIKPEQGKMALIKVPIPKEWQPEASLPYEQRYPTRFPGE